jgi:very-short-patch-repair endonuclease
MALVDFAAYSDSVSVRFAFLEACRLGHFGRDDVEPCFRRIEGRRGASKVRPLLRLWVPELGRIRSVLEGLFLLAWSARGLQMPRVNTRVCGFEVDCFWPASRLVVELDGRGYHDDPLARARDAARDRIIGEAGFPVARFGYRQVRDRPDQVVTQVAELLADPERPWCEIGKFSE